MLGTLKHFAKTFRAPVAAEREFIYIKPVAARFDLEARERHVVARGFYRAQAAGC